MKVIPSHIIELSIDVGNGRISHFMTHKLQGCIAAWCVVCGLVHTRSAKVWRRMWTHITTSVALMRLVHTQRYISALSKLHRWWICPALPRPCLMVCPRWPSALLDIDGWIAIKLNPRSPNWFLVDFILCKLDFSLVASYGVSEIWFESEREMLREENRQISLKSWCCEGRSSSWVTFSWNNHCFCSQSFFLFF